MHNVLLIILVCAGNTPREECTSKTARNEIHLTLEQPVCTGVGALISYYTIADQYADEYTRIRCQW